MFLHHNTSAETTLNPIAPAPIQHTLPQAVTSLPLTSNSLSGGWERQKTVKLLQPPPLLTTSMLTLLTTLQQRFLHLFICNMQQTPSPFLQKQKSGTIFLTWQFIPYNLIKSFLRSFKEKSPFYLIKHRRCIFKRQSLIPTPIHRQ